MENSSVPKWALADSAELVMGQQSPCLHCYNQRVWQLPKPISLLRAFVPLLILTGAQGQPLMGLRLFVCKMGGRWQWSIRKGTALGQDRCSAH